MKLLKSYKTEINPTLEQKNIINRTIGVCRYVYNFYLAHNKETYANGGKFISGMDFSKWLNNNYLPQNEEFAWIKEVYAKSVKQSMLNAERAFKRFFKGQSEFPKFKKKSKSDVKMYFVKNDAKMIIECERHRVKIPTLGWTQIKEKGYIPAEQVQHDKIIKSGSVSKKADRYYVSVLVEESNVIPTQSINADGLGIDLGLKDFAVISDRTVKKNINKKSAVKKAEKKLKREQRKLSRKYESLKKRNKNNKKGETTRQNIKKQVVKVQKLHHRLDNIRTDYINKIVNDLAKTKPDYITIENLNISGMMKNKHLSKAVAQQKFYEFRTKLEHKCKQDGIELRVVDRFYPSSKLCHECGNIKSDLKLSDRIYKCECGYIEDRDYNASLNLRDAKVYKIS
jgi:putative transposase